MEFRGQLKISAIKQYQLSMWCQQSHYFDIRFTQIGVHVSGPSLNPSTSITKLIYCIMGECQSGLTLKICSPTIWAHFRSIFLTKAHGMCRIMRIYRGWSKYHFDQIILPFNFKATKFSGFLNAIYFVN